MALDIHGKKIDIDDLVVLGFDNGSSLMIGCVVKITPKLIFVQVRYGTNSEFTHRRAHSRVAVYEKKVGVKKYLERKNKVFSEN